ncbi:MAG: hypothetical protein LBD76_05645 [Prevotellaceae bacterium]|nr:hypothetical protein [Prevotellaceae bacterium]
MNKQRRKILIGWLLVILFALPPAAKDIHVCQCVYIQDHDHDHDHANSNNRLSHDCDTCAICQFVVFPFTEAESTEYVCIVETIYSKSYTYQEHINSSIVYNYMLRAPPCA